MPVPAAGCTITPSASALPLSLFFLTVPHSPNLSNNTHTFLFLILMFWVWEIAEGAVRDADTQLGTISLAISCFPLPSPLSASVPSLFMPPSLCLYLLLLLCTHLFCLTSLHSLLLPQHSCTCPLTCPHHPLALIHSINHSPHSSFFISSAHLYIFPTEHVLKYWKFDVLSSHSSVEMMSCNKSKSINIC